MGIPTCVGKTLGELSQTCWELVHPHVRGADVHEPNGAVLPWQPGTAVIPNFGDTALSPASSTSSAPLSCSGAVPCLGGIDLWRTMPRENRRVPQSRAVPCSPVGLTKPRRT